MEIPFTCSITNRISEPEDRIEIIHTEAQELKQTNKQIKTQPARSGSNIT